MNDLEMQERLAGMTVPELIETITRLEEIHAEYRTVILQEILVRSMQEAGKEQE